MDFSSGKGNLGNLKLLVVLNEIKLLCIYRAKESSQSDNF